METKTGQDNYDIERRKKCLQILDNWLEDLDYLHLEKSHDNKDQRD